MTKEERQELIYIEICNFILYYTSDDTLRVKMYSTLEDYMHEVYEGGN